MHSTLSTTEPHLSEPVTLSGFPIFPFSLLSSSLSSFQAVESEQCPSFSESLKAGKPVYTKTLPTLADGLAVPLVGANSFTTAKDLIDRCVVVTEDDIAMAILQLVEVEKCVVEGAGASGLAACISGQLSHLKGKK